MIVGNYPVSLMCRARELREAGWTCDQVTERLALEFNGPTPVRETVRLWTSSHALLEKQAKRRDAETAKRLERPTAGRLGRRNHTREYQEFRVRLLADAGVPYVSIAKVMAFDYPDGQWNDDRVRKLLGPSRERRALQVAA